MMSEDTTIREAPLAMMAWTAEPTAYIRWCPGDSTQYRVNLILSAPSIATPDYESPFEALLVRCAELHILVPRLPFGDKWDAHAWLRRQLPAGWWAGVRPLLAALRWADGPPIYRRSDAVEIGRLERSTAHA